MKVWACSPVMYFQVTEAWLDLEEESSALFLEETIEARGILVPSARVDPLVYEFSGTREGLDVWVKRVNRFFPWNILGVDDALD